jgi:hypothetical protein
MRHKTAIKATVADDKIIMNYEYRRIWKEKPMDSLKPLSHYLL